MGWAERINPHSWYNRSRAMQIKEAQMIASLGRAIKRFARTALALIITGAVAAATKEPKWIIFAPVINAVAKYLRDRFGLKYIPL